MLELVLELELETNYNRERAVPVEQSEACSILCSALGVLGELSLDMLAWLLGRQGGGREGFPTTLLLVRQKTAEPGLLTQTEPASLSPPVASRN